MMKLKYLAALVATVVMSAEPLMASEFKQVQVQLEHPANGDSLFIPGAKALLQSGHSSDSRWLSWVDLTTNSAKQVPIPTQAQFFHKAQLKGQPGEQLVVFGSQGVSAFNAQDSSWQRLLNTESLYRTVDGKRLLKLDFVYDFNNDGLSDFIVPDFNAHHVYMQQQDGSFTKFSLAVEAKSRLFDENPDYSIRKARFLDWNADGRTDIAFAIDDSLVLYLQTETGFSTVAQTVELGLGLTPDALAEVRGGDGRSFKGLSINRLYDVKDLNNDSIADLIVRQEQFADAVEQSYSYRIHYGQTGADGLQFKAQPDARINTKGIQSEPEFTDLNNDKKLDFFTPAAEFGIGTLVRALLAGTANMELQFFPQLQSGKFPDKAVYRQDATAQVSIGNAQVNLPVLKVLVSEQAPALLLIGDEDHLKLYQSAKEKLFSSKSIRLKQAIPLNGMLATTADLDQNGKMDLILPFTHLDPEAVRNQLHFILQQ
ncbi:FG-GAP repeat domain-containing protein [Rheinheimera faecalis]|uniref:FG-GAP repeat domain-containing protein n=1 Tax=Rheinheimera faecalis TaxID=2901141 RepID=UPI001E4BD028|nr:VCBS repeat-containing protein [Rheinheimera faecalis]